MTLNSQILYIPTASPPTPSPSPPPPTTPTRAVAADPLEPLTPNSRRTFITSIIGACTSDELLYISETISPLLKRDLISALPPEIGLCILSFVDTPLTLVRVSAVSRKWRVMALSEELWRGMCLRWAFDVRRMDCDVESGRGKGKGKEIDDEPLEEMEPFAEFPMDPAPEWLLERKRKARRFKSSQSANISTREISYRVYFKNSYKKLVCWKTGGRLFRTHRLPMLSSPPLLPSNLYPSPHSQSYSAAHTQSRISPPLLTDPSEHQPDSGVVTCIALDASWIVVGLASSRIHIFSARTGVLARTLVGHESGVWGLCLVSAFGRQREEVGDRTSRTSKRKQAQAQEDEDFSTNAELWRSLPPALKHAVGLDPECEGDPDLNNDENVDQNPDSETMDEDIGEEHYQGQIHSQQRQKTNANSWKERYIPERQSNPCYASEGWGQPNALVVSGGCDKVVRVWDVKSGHCIYTLSGHTSTIRCMRILHNCPLAITGSRDGTLRTWDIQRGRQVRVLEGHNSSVRCLDVNGRRAVSGSYDTTCRVWDLDTGKCLHVLWGHYHQVYSVAFDGVLVATGGLDTTIRIWDAETGVCQALLQGHTALVCQLQLSRKHQLLATGGSDGRVITFSLSSSEASNESRTILLPPHFSREETMNGTSLPYPRLRLPYSRTQIRTRTGTRASNTTRTPYEPLYRLSAHTSSVTSLQFDGRFLVTSGNDGCVHVWQTRTGKYVRRLGGEGEGVWKVGFVGFAGADIEGTREEEGGTGMGKEGWGSEAKEESEGEEIGDVCVVAGRREGKTVLDVWGFWESLNQEL
ncbi:F-box/WD repeat-containing protein 7 [Termitomyces sp. T112]|nr:F-box/WD repeat-containing protein 7 [Termitomyces sp. T112]